MPGDLVRPGHVFPLRSVEGSVLRRAGRTEASVDLATAAGLYPGGLLAEAITDDGKVARRPELEALAHAHDLTMVSINDIIRYRRRSDKLIRRMSQARLSTSYGDFTIHASNRSPTESSTHWLRAKSMAHLTSLRESIRNA